MTDDKKLFNSVEDLIASMGVAKGPETRPLKSPEEMGHGHTYQVNLQLRNQAEVKMANKIANTISLMMRNMPIDGAVRSLAVAESALIVDQAFNHPDPGSVRNGLSAEFSLVFHHSLQEISNARKNGR